MLWRSRRNGIAAITNLIPRKNSDRSIISFKIKDKRYIKYKDQSSDKTGDEGSQRDEFCAVAKS
jgi:hypothetical protein